MVVREFTGGLSEVEMLPFPSQAASFSRIQQHFKPERGPAAAHYRLFIEIFPALPLNYFPSTLLTAIIMIAVKEEADA